MSARDRSYCALCDDDCTDEEHALTHEQAAPLGLDADIAEVCLGCLCGLYAARDARAERAVSP